MKKVSEMDAEEVGKYLRTPATPQQRLDAMAVTSVESFREEDRLELANAQRLAKGYNALPVGLFVFNEGNYAKI